MTSWRARREPRPAGLHEAPSNRYAAELAIVRGEEEYRKRRGTLARKRAKTGSEANDDASNAAIADGERHV